MMNNNEPFTHEREFWNDFSRTSREYAARAFGNKVDEGYIPLGHPWADSRAYIYQQIGDVLGKRVLDCGAGTGWLSIVMAKRGAATVTAIDVADRMLQLLQDLARENGVAGRITTRTAAIETADFPPGSFDIVTCIDVLHHTGVEQAVDRIHGWLRPGGIAVMSDPLADSRLVEWAKGLVPVSRMGTTTERGLRLDDILNACRGFSQVSHREFQLFSRLDRFVNHRLVRGTLLKLDAALLGACPSLRRYARIAVIRAVK
jgi:2-polyprenyl-3-methyl-5-hydroxy-6-metoxy-1,4-benzoquinol methylase